MAEALSVFTCANFWVFGFLNVWKSVCMEVTVDAESDLSFPMTVPIGDNGVLVPDVQKVTLRKLSYFKWLAEGLRCNPLKHRDFQLPLAVARPSHAGLLTRRALACRRYGRICCAIPAASISPIAATICGLSRTILATGIRSTPSTTRASPAAGLKTSGVDRIGCSVLSDTPHSRLRQGFDQVMMQRAEAEVEHAAQVDVCKGDGCNPRQRRRGPAAPEGLCKTLHLRHVPRHHDIRQQRQGAGDRDQLLARSTMPGADRTVMDRSLQLMHGLALIENPLQFTAKTWIAEQVTQIDRAQELAECVAAFVGRVALGSRAIQVEYRWWRSTIRH